MNSYIKIFLKFGIFAILLFLLYEIIVLLSVSYYGIFAIFLSWAPFYLTSRLFSNPYLLIFSTFLFYFILGGLIGLIINFIKLKLKNKIKK